MTIPLDRLYHFVENVAEKIYGDPVIIYRFWPHGSKNIENLHPLRTTTWFQISSTLHIWCNDQEPLDHEFYSKNFPKWEHAQFTDLLKSIDQYPAPTNLHWAKNWFKKNLLLHSEKRSLNIKKYQQDDELIPVYYWNHAMLALDWFRYADHEIFHKQPNQKFLIYNRSWSGTREYRLKFCDLLIDYNLTSHCRTSFNPMDPESDTHYDDHRFKNNCWRPKNHLENFFSPTQATAASSADFVTEDYEQTSIEVVLETLFDDDRLHLTEKSLRPMACGQPFILAATHGSLEYLRGYGFRTFADVWDESYDLEPDPNTRLDKIIKLMREIADWNADTRNSKMQAAEQIAEYNRRWFFSPDFFELVVNELQTNLESAFCELESCKNYQWWLERWTRLLSYPEVIEFLKTNQDQRQPTQDSVNDLMKSARLKLDQKSTTSANIETFNTI